MPTILKEGVEILETFEAVCIESTIWAINTPSSRCNLEGLEVGEVYQVERTEHAWHISYWCPFLETRCWIGSPKTFPRRFLKRIQG